MQISRRSSFQVFNHIPRNTFRFSQSRFLFYSAVLLMFGLICGFYLNLYILLIFSLIIVLFWTLIRQQHRRRAHYLATFKIPQYVWRAFDLRHPNIGLTSRQVIEEGFKDYLAMHLWQKRAYAMPSHAVDALWHLLLEDFDGYYRNLCQEVLGYMLNHKPHESQPSPMQRGAQQQQLMHSWQAACQIHGLDPKNSPVLARLFQVDSVTQWPNGIQFSLPMLIAMYAHLLNSASDHLPATSNSSCSSTATSCTSSCSGSASEVSHSGHASHGSSSSDSGSSSDSSCSSCGGGGD